MGLRLGSDMKTWRCFPEPQLRFICYPLEGTWLSRLSCWRTRCVGPQLSLHTSPDFSCVWGKKSTSNLSACTFPHRSWVSGPLSQGHSENPAGPGNAQHTILPASTPQSIPLHPQHPRNQAPPRCRGSPRNPNTAAPTLATFVNDKEFLGLFQELD